MPRLGDELAQGFDVDSAGDDLVADDEAGCSADAELLRQGVVVGEDFLDFRRIHVGLEAIHIEAVVAGNPQGVGLIEPRPAAHHGNVEHYMTKIFVNYPM